MGDHCLLASSSCNSTAGGRESNFKRTPAFIARYRSCNAMFMSLTAGTPLVKESTTFVCKVFRSIFLVIFSFSFSSTAFLAKNVIYLRSTLLAIWAAQNVITLHLMLLSKRSLQHFSKFFSSFQTEKRWKVLFFMSEKWFLDAWTRRGENFSPTRFSFRAENSFRFNYIE